MMSSDIKEGGSTFSGEELLTEVLGDPIESPLEIEETAIETTTRYCTKVHSFV